MADHVREQIAVAAVALATGLATTGSRVYRDRDTEAQPLQSAELPGLTLEDDGDPAEIITLGVSRYLERRMRIRISAHVKASSGYSAQLNQILKELEVAFAPSAAIGGAKYVTLADVAGREVAGAAELPIVRQVFTFEFLYYTAAGAPDVAL